MTPLAPLRSRAVLIALLVAAGAHVLWMSFLCDDAFIAFRYAANLADGHGLVYQPGERVEGFTNLLWVLIGAAGARLGLPPERLAVPLGAGIALLGLAVLLERRRRAGRGFAIPGVLLAACPGWAAWATGGLETALFTTLVTLAYLALVEESEAVDAEGGPGRGRGLTIHGALLGAAVLTRPEGTLFAVTTAAWLVARGPRDGVRLRQLAGWAGLWLVPLAALEIGRLAYYGRWLPNTYAAKAHGLALIGSGATYLGFAALRMHLWIPAAGILVAGLARGRRPRGEEPDERGWREPKVSLALATALPYLIHVAIAGGDFMDGFRFVVPVLPMLFVVAGEMLEGFARRGRLAAIVTASLLLAYVGLGIETSRDSRRLWTRHGLDSIGLLRRYVDDWSALGRHLATIAGPSDTLATAAAGCVPYYSGLTTLDQHGLTAVDLSSYEPAAKARPGHAIVLRADSLLAAQPTWILGSPQVRVRGEAPRTEFLIGPGARATLERDYELLDVRLPGSGGRRCVVAKRKGA